MSDFSTRFAEKFAAAADRAGMRVDALVRPKDCTVRPYTVRVAFERPDAFIDGAQSSEWMVEYVATDAPLLAEGDEIEIEEIVYRVRRAPYVSAGGEGGVDGTFMRALLTRVATDCE